MYAVITAMLVPFQHVSGRMGSRGLDRQHKRCLDQGQRYSIHVALACGHAVQALLPLFPDLLLQLPSTAFTATSLLLLVYLGPTMWYLWMDLGTGNANFYYAITLLWAAWQVTACM